MLGCVPSLFIRVLGICLTDHSFLLEIEPVGGNAHYSFKIVLFISVKYWLYLSHKLDQYLLALSYYCQWWHPPGITFETTVILSLLASHADVFIKDPQTLNWLHYYTVYTQINTQ